MKPYSQEHGGPHPGYFTRLGHLRLLVLLVLLLPAGLCQAQSTATVLPEELVQIPSREVSDDPYWHQLVVTLGADIGPSDRAMTVALPLGIIVPDTNGDQRFSDEVRVLYQSVGDEAPGLFVSQRSTQDTIVVGSALDAATGGLIYLQFPVLAKPIDDIELLLVELGRDFPDLIPFSYQSITFADASADTIAPGPEIVIVGPAEFNVQGSMNVVVLEQPLAAGADTATTGLGTYYPETVERLVQNLPDLVFDNGPSHANNLLGFGDGDDTNDVTYSFFWSTDPTLSIVNAGTATPVLLDNGGTHTETEGTADPVRLLTRDLTEGTYYLYAVSNVTGRTPLARSRGLQVRHEPLIQQLGPESAITLDSGGLFDLSDAVTGKGVSRFAINYAVTDHDDVATTHLFFSDNPDLGDANIALNVSGEVASLIGALPITSPGGLQEEIGTVTWHIRVPDNVLAGTYHIYGVAEDGRNQSLLRSEHPVVVRHSPFLRLDAFRDDLLAAPDTIVTGGFRPQRHLTFTWGRAGIDGDLDNDSDAAISLYYSSMPATTGVAADSLTIPGGSTQLTVELAAAEGRTNLITAGIAENPDARADNQYVWSLWSLDAANAPVAGVAYYLYGLIEDDTAGWLTQLNGGLLNDMSSKVVFAHPPFIRPLQPAAAVTLTPGLSTAASWEDIDLDDDAAIRVILTADDLGVVTDYATLTSSTAFVVNSADGRAAPEVDRSFDLSEDDMADSYDIDVTHLQRSLGREEPPVPGEYFVYLAIEEGDSFAASSMACRAPGKILLDAGVAADGESFRLLPEVFSLGIGGMSQRFELRVDAEGASVDLVVARMQLEVETFEVVDQDEELSGIQPFRVGSGLSANQLFVNEVALNGDDLELTMAYLDPDEIRGLDGESPVASFVVRTLSTVGPADVELLADPTAPQFSHLEFRGTVVATPDPRILATGTLLSGRTVSGHLLLEGRVDRATEVDVSLREWGSYSALQDSAFAFDNDVNLEREGVQILLAADGTFDLVNVPAGQLDLFAPRRLPGCLGTRTPGNRHDRPARRAADQYRGSGRQPDVGR